MRDACAAMGVVDKSTGEPLAPLSIARSSAGMSQASFGIVAYATISPSEGTVQLEGIHHITAITGDAPANVDFYARVLGLRLVAKTVNQDDPTVYHLFYADEEGTPGADLTFFEYPGAAPGRPGAGMIHRIEWAVEGPEALDFWADRLVAEGVATDRGDGWLRFADPEGMGHELIAGVRTNAPLTAYHPEIPAAHALQGFLGVRAYSARPEGSAQLLEDVLGATRADSGEDVFEVGGDHRRSTIAWDPAPQEPGVPGGGTVHHIAWGTTAAEHPRWVEYLHDAGVRSTDVIDRHYFHSIYFREPGGVLYEIADDEPGFTVDLPLEELGTKIILPPWLESHREQIEARLTPLPDPRADWTAPAPGRFRPATPVDR
jgi:glyoxalase family protein